MTEAYLFALANLCLCALISVVAICRLNSMGDDVLFRVQCEYNAYLTASIVSGLQPLWQEWPQWGSISMAVAILIGMFASASAWKGDKPPDSATHWPPLGN